MTPQTAVLRIGNWRVDTVSGQMAREGETVRLDARALRLLLCLAARPGEVVSIDELLNQGWPGVTVSPDSVYQAMAALRRLFGDDPKQPAYIATVPRLGYQMIAPVEQWKKSSTPIAPHEASAPSPLRYHKLAFAKIAAVVLCIILGTGLFLYHRSKVHRDENGRASASTAVATSPQKSIAVLPFLDLTEGMKQGEFADGMTEELIDKLSKVSGLRVPSPTASFYYRDKELALPEIARALGVTYILDGSVRKSGNRVRVAVRLVRADNGYVIWSETYDRPFNDILMIQDDIADKATGALKTAIEGQSPQP